MLTYVRTAFPEAPEFTEEHIESLDGVLHEVHDSLSGSNIEQKLSQLSPFPSLEVLWRAYKEVCFTPDESKIPEKTAAIEERIIPFVGIEKREPHFKAQLSRRRAGACPDAELFFNDARGQANSGEYVNQPEISVCHDAGYNPSLFRITYESSIALTLVPIQVSKTIIPPGAIVAEDPSMENHKNLTGVRHFDDFTLTSYEATEELAISPLRLSAWVYDEPDLRSQFANNPEGAKAAMLAGVELDDYRDSASHLINATHAQSL